MIILRPNIYLSLVPSIPLSPFAYLSNLDRQDTMQRASSLARIYVSMGLFVPQFAPGMIPLPVFLSRILLI